MISIREQMERRNAGLPPPCVETSNTSPTLSVYLPDGQTWILAWSRFSHAHLRGEELILVFSDHEVEIRGQNLAHIMRDIATLHLECVRTIPVNYRPAVNDREPFINEIEVLPV